jgi:hypothetical protein
MERAKSSRFTAPPSWDGFFKLRNVNSIGKSLDDASVEKR